MPHPCAKYKEVKGILLLNYRDSVCNCDHIIYSGQPMVVKMLTPASARIKEVPQKLPPSVKPVEAEPLKYETTCVLFFCCNLTKK